MNKLARITLVAITPLLAGCFEASQTVVVTADGTATMTFEVAVAPARAILELMIPPEQLALMPEAQLNEMIEQVGGGRGEELCTPDEADVPVGYSVSVETFIRDDGNEVCRATMVGPIGQLGEALNQSDADTVVTLLDEGGGIYSFHMAIPLSEDEGDIELFDDETLALIAAAAEDSFVMMSITAPRIIETDGELNGNTATFQIPGFAILAAPTEAYEFNVRFALR